MFFLLQLGAEVLNIVLFGLHGGQGHVQQLIQLPAQILRTLTDHVAGAAGGELLVLKLFLTAA